ncbi:hypothetical protein Purlil1_12568 [Purpureocillium lilacinum]|uniref:Uncharacterized protein n=1 Tax=Purpureocillium lilacinum TaxID=33203 RepID=A0ABR0BGJ0_PURLI|nr:hypothetical protein Purlil1_12568 [Purpureocillium lilacinum]
MLPSPIQPATHCWGQSAMVSVPKEDRIMVLGHGQELLEDTMTFGKAAGVFSLMTFWDPALSSHRLAVHLPPGQTPPDIESLLCEQRFHQHELKKKHRASVTSPERNAWRQEPPRMAQRLRIPPHDDRRDLYNVHGEACTVHETANQNRFGAIAANMGSTRREPSPRGKFLSEHERSTQKRPRVEDSGLVPKNSPLPGAVKTRNTAHISGLVRDRNHGGETGATSQPLFQHMSLRRPGVLSGVAHRLSHLMTELLAESTQESEISQGILQIKQSLVHHSSIGGSSRPSLQSPLSAGDNAHTMPYETDLPARLLVTACISLASITQIAEGGTLRDEDIKACLLHTLGYDSNLQSVCEGGAAAGDRAGQSWLDVVIGE